LTPPQMRGKNWDWDWDWAMRMRSVARVAAGGWSYFSCKPPWISPFDFPSLCYLPAMRERKLHRGDLPIAGAKCLKYR